MTFSSRMTNTAIRLLTIYGEEILFSRSTEGAFVPSTGDVGTPNDLTYTGYGHPSPFNTDEVDENTILGSDIRLLVHKMTQIPLVGDVATFGGTDYRVMRVEKLKAQGSDIAYRLQLRS
jgi:hypothetical protein